MALNQNFSRNMLICENQHKLIHHWFLTSKKFAKMYPQIDDRCWCCNETAGDVYHV